MQRGLLKPEGNALLPGGRVGDDVTDVACLGCEDRPLGAELDPSRAADLLRAVQ